MAGNANNNQKSNNLFEQYSQLDSGLNAFEMFNGGAQYQIATYLVPSSLQDKNRFSRNNALYLQWRKDVEELNFYDKLFDFGLSGNMVVIDNMGSLSFLLEQFISYELVINITQKVTENAPNLRFEPYILNIISVEPISPPGKQPRKLRIHFEDLLTATAKKTSLGAFIKINPGFKETRSFTEAFITVIEYIKDIIFNNNGTKFAYVKGTKFSNYNTVADEACIIETILDKLDNDNSLYDLLSELVKKACVAIKVPDKLSSQVAQFEMPTDVLIPLYCREEYTDIRNLYYTYYKETPDDTTAGTSGEVYVHRPFSLRNFYMPFELAFKDDQPTIFESYSTEANIISTGETTINGINQEPIEKIESLTSDVNLAARRWKNLSFLTSNANGGTSFLVYFDWIYQFFNKIFLNGNAGKPNVKVSNILPQFYLAELNDPNLHEDKDFSEKNSNVYLIENEKVDPLREMFMQIGKSIASLVLLNNSYSFDVSGNLLRRSNEIINLYVPAGANEESPSPIRTDLAMSKNVMLYTTAIIHSFKGNAFRDKVICNRIYEKAEE